MKTNDSLSAIAEFLKNQSVFTLICHVRPDGDTLGCAFGLKSCLAALGKRAQVLCADPVSPRYRFLTGGRALLTGEPEGVVVCLDVAAPEMAGRYEPLARQADLVIDHHPTNPRFGKMNYVDPAAAAAGEILLSLAELLGVLPPDAAAAFYTAISTDTGCFKYGNTTGRTHLAAAKLAEKGIDLNALNHRLFRTKSRAEFELERRAMETLKSYAGGRIVTMLISCAMLRETGAGPDELETISSLPMQLEGVQAAATFKELEPGVFKVSLRTAGGIDGGAVCASFGGGGHKMAAGCSMEGRFSELEPQMVAALTAALKE